jgi:general L-amino acid transport system permease protein
MKSKISVVKYDREYPVGEYPDLAPPVSTQGIFGWLRENLFPNWRNSLLTIILVIWLGHIIPPVIKWGFINSTTSGQSSQQCLIAQRSSAFAEEEFATGIQQRVLLESPAIRQEPLAANFWTKSGYDNTAMRLLSSVVLFQSPALDDVLNAKTMQLEEVQKYLSNQSRLLGTVQRNIDSINKDQAKEYKAADKLFSKALGLLAEPAEEVAADPLKLSAIFKDLDKQLKVIDIRRVYKDKTTAVDYETIRTYQPYRFNDAKNAASYDSAKEFYLENHPEILVAMKHAEAAATERAETFLHKDIRNVFNKVDLKIIQTKWDAATENNDPKALKASLAEMAPLLHWAEKNNGACWTYPKERWWKAFTFGAFPEFEKWRPILVFIWLILAVVPALAPPFKGRDSLWIFTITLPFAAYSLLTGDTIIEQFVRNGVDGEVDYSMRGMLALFLLGFAMLPSIFIGMSSTVRSAWWIITGVAVVWLLSGDALSKPVFESLFTDPANYDPLVDTSDYKSWGGIMLNILLGVTGILFSLPIGVALALGRRSDMPVIGYICTLVIEVIRGVPLITILFMGALVFPYFVPSSWDIDALPRMIIAVTMFSAAYMAEVIRGGLQGLNKGQYEGAAALGLNYTKAHRLIILPQALKIVIPGIVNTFIGLFKDTTLISVVAVGLFEILGTNNQHLKGNADWRSVENEGYMVVGLFFFIFCFLMARYSIWLEKRLDTGHRS